MNDTNHVTITGRLGSDCELRYTPKGTAINKFSLAVNELWTGEDGQKRERVHWVNVVAWDKGAEIVAQYCGKGSHILVDGKLTFDQWDDKQTGKKRSALSVTMQRVQFIDTKPPGAQPQPSGPQSRLAPAPQPDTGDGVPF